MNSVRNCSLAFTLSICLNLLQVTLEEVKEMAEKKEIELFEKYVLGNDTLIKGVSPSELAKQLENQRMISHDTVITIIHDSQASPQNQVITLLKYVHSRLREDWWCFPAFLDVLHCLGNSDLAFKMSEECYGPFEGLMFAYPIETSCPERVQEAPRSPPVAQEPPGKWYLMQS